MVVVIVVAVVAVVVVVLLLILCFFVSIPIAAAACSNDRCNNIESTWMHERAGWAGGRCTQLVHSRSRMTIDPPIPTMPGRSTSGFHQPGRHCLHQARGAVRCSASRMKGGLHPSKNRL